MVKSLPVYPIYGKPLQGISYSREYNKDGSFFLYIFCTQLPVMLGSSSTTIYEQGLDFFCTRFSGKKLTILYKCPLGSFEVQYSTGNILIIVLLKN